VAGERVSFVLRPFEVAMLEVSPAADRRPALPQRPPMAGAADMGRSLALAAVPLDGRMNVQFADAARFEQQGHVRRTYAFETELPPGTGDQPVLAITVRLRVGAEEWRYSPKVVEIVQAMARLGDQNLQLIPVPDGRQYGNTQKAGCSWVLYKTRLARRAAGRLSIAVHAYLPAGVEAQVEAWVVQRWWQENARPIGDGYYTDAPS
jgi:hypothetical protein